MQLAILGPPKGVFLRDIFEKQLTFNASGESYLHGDFLYHCYNTIWIATAKVESFKKTASMKIRKEYAQPGIMIFPSMFTQMEFQEIIEKTQPIKQQSSNKKDAVKGL